MWPHNDITGRDSSVGKANRYGPDGPGIQSRWDEFFFLTVQTGSGVHQASCKMGPKWVPGYFTGVKMLGPGIDRPPNQYRG